METGPFDSLGWIEIVVTGAIALGLGFWQLWSVNREIAKDKEKAAAKDRVEEPKGQ
ncbi:MAG: hypothetical protein GW808_04425 [Sphingomonadales bacterium]|nr:hypothetical protein [Sphingomonadales bacterium]NCO48863.1 hypothetical protein [Sphingomonadales bacterium]NCO99378.1 hypothetical protein [Sphingomonadales bacterium]NCP27003.1 hypothetical protein [Sphingomonadales bacterium]NCP42299.1 hypothetical protein [Sphingomonadales bacterium]